MSLGQIRGRIPGPRRGAPAARGHAPVLLESLESRRLLSAALPAHAAVNAACVTQAAPVQAVALTSSSTLRGGVVVLNSSSVCAQATGTTAGQEDASGSGSASAAADSAPVERLTNGSAFHGYDYIPPDGSAPPALPTLHVVQLPVLTWSKPQGSAVNGVPPKIKKSVEGEGDSSGPSLTPLAQTPASVRAAASPTIAARESVGVPNPGPVISPAPTSVAANLHGGTSSPFLSVSGYGGTVAAVMPVEAVLAAHSAVPMPAGISQGIAYASNRAADALSLVASADGMAGTVAYNFVHFNPALLLNDAIATFARESASLSAVQPPAHSNARAWLVTGAVVAADLLLVGYWYQNRRQQQKTATLVRPVPPAVVRRRRDPS